MNSIEEILALVRSVNADEFEEQLTSGQELDDLLTEIRFLTEKLESRKQRMHEMIEQITECFAGNFFQELPISEAQDELDVISMGFNTYMEELSATMVSKEELEQTNSKLIAEMERSEQLSAAKDEFLSNMSHEIRTPLNGILGFVNILINNGVLPVQYQKQLQNAKVSGEILMVIINDVLDLSKIDAGKMTLEERSVSLHEISQLIYGTFSNRIIEKELEFKLTIGKNVPDFVLMDSVRLSQILFNFVSNSIKFTPEKGTIELHIGLIAGKDNQELLTFSVIDSGIGIAADKIEDIFSPFVQTTNDTARKFGGTGLGLTIVKKIIELMNGSVKVESQPGIKTQFTAYLPYKKSDDDLLTISEPLLESIEPIPSISKEPNGSRIKLLLAEDNAINQLIVQTVMENNNIDVTTVENGKLAVEEIEKTDFDIVLMDIMMPEMDGYEATLAIRALKNDQKRNIPIIALTAVVSSSVSSKCSEIGMNAYFSKPFDANELLEKIVELVENRAIWPYEIQ